MKLRTKQQVFVEEYLVDFNATQAAIRAGYSPKTARSIGSENLTKPDIKQLIDERMMGKDEVILRLSDIGRGNISDLMDITTSGFTFKLLIDGPDGTKIPNPKTKLIKKIRQKVTTFLSKRESEEDREVIETEFELYSAHDALRDLGRVHALFTDKVKVEDGWRTEIVGLLRSGMVTKQDVLDEVDNTLAIELFREAGIETE